MSMEELAEEYRHSAALCRERVRELRAQLETAPASETERLLLRRRISILVTMAADTAAIAGYLKHYYGRTKRRGDHSLRTGDGISDAARDPEARLLNVALREELTERQAQMVRMYYIEQHTMRDIAGMLGVNISTVSRTLAAARKRLKRCLKYASRTLLRAED